MLEKASVLPHMGLPTCYLVECLHNMVADFLQTEQSERDEDRDRDGDRSYTICVLASDDT